jgi:predicted DNA-binding protein (MmcQ/YjbR family)
MNIEDIRNICTALPQVTEDIKWEDHLCFCIGEKMFLVTAPDQFPVSASIKVSDEEFEELSAREGMQPAPYMARYKWVHMDDINRLSRKEWEKYIREAYHLIAARLPAKTRKQLGIQ